jgi:dATP pyrophosphohydrolase
MPHVLSDIVDVYVFRRLNARVQFLLLQRRSDVALPYTWQAFHSQVRVGDTTLQTITETVKSLAGLNVSAIYSADYINQFYDEGRDAIVLAPVFAVNVSPQSPIDLGDDYRDAAWFGRDEATARLPFSGQRWAVRHIDEIMSLGEAESGIYQIDMATVQPRQQMAGSVDDLDDDDQVTEQYDETSLATVAPAADAGHAAEDGQRGNSASGDEEGS